MAQNEERACLPFILGTIGDMTVIFGTYTVRQMMISAGIFFIFGKF